MSTTPQVFSIQHFCVHDGPGIRSVVFLKGCPLRCSWCQNPESWLLDSELGHKRRRCIECGACVKTCPTGAMKAPGKWSLETCDRCFRCVAGCPSGALTRFGEPRTADSVHAELAKEFALYRQSGGGVTFSGGEASLFPEYVVSLLGPLQAGGIHVAMETCGLFRFKSLRPVDELLADDDAWHAFSSQVLWQAVGGLDLVLFDLKLMNRARHREHCGADSEHIHDNFRLLAALMHAGRGPRLWPRLPLVPGITDDEENIRAVARFVREAGLDSITLLPYHNLGVEKFEWLQQRGTFSAAMLPESQVRQARHIVESEDLRCFEPGEEDYGPMISI